MEVSQSVKDADHWNQILAISEQKLVVVDLHKSWCGPCKIMEPTYKRLIAEIENAQERLLFVSLDQSMLLIETENTPSCKPRFLLFRERKPIVEIAGANAPKLEFLVRQHCPSLKSNDEDP
ncbi:unnamed protein product [Albugo candida]|nr:unnamed protein product [Albugo candida]|eukprot:CCI44325.1 unnamed protein product [Albugo candida]